MAINIGFDYPQVARDAGFKIRKYCDGQMDWRILGSIEIQELLEEQDLQKLDMMLYQLCEAPLGKILETNILEHRVGKYFIVSQFAIQYLMFCRTFLEETVVDIKEVHSETQKELLRLRKLLGESKNEVLQMNRKLLNIEKEREVVYPCHFCSKSFISNESLNIHIGHKHPLSGDRSVSSDRFSDTSIVQRERENDLTLINTIKLELEIKQLKERLNAAEKEIKERSAINSVRCTPRDFNRKYTKDVGIQNDLNEQKEQDDCIILQASVAKIKGETLQQLAEKVHEFEIWRDKLRADYDKFIVDINKKFELLAQTLEANNLCQYQSEDKLQKFPISSMEELETLLIQKVSEIGITSARKLEEVVNRMEENYKLKLFELEQDIKMRNTESLPIQNIDSNTSISKVLNEKISSDTFTITESKSNPQELSYQSHTAEETHREVHVDKYYDQNEGNTIEEAKSQENSSNAEFEKGYELKSTIYRNGSELSKESKFQPSDKPTTSPIKRTRFKKMKYSRSIKKKTVACKELSRNNAIKLVNHEMVRHGINLQTKLISRSRMKRICTQMADKRNLLKEKYPQIYEVRNQLKKFVEKLCSADQSEDVKILLNYTGIYDKIKKTNIVQPLKSDIEANGKTKTTTTFSHQIRSTYLDLSDEFPTTSSEAILKSANSKLAMPRKRVVFNSTEFNRTDSIDKED